MALNSKERPQPGPLRLERRAAAGRADRHSRADAVRLNESLRDMRGSCARVSQRRLAMPPGPSANEAVGTLNRRDLAWRLVGAGHRPAGLARDRAGSPGR